MAPQASAITTVYVFVAHSRTRHGISVRGDTSAPLAIWWLRLWLALWRGGGSIVDGRDG